MFSLSETVLVPPQLVKPQDALARSTNRCSASLIQALRQGPNAEQAFDAAYAAESMEKIVRLEAALDARIAKVLARLVGLGVQAHPGCRVADRAHQLPECVANPREAVA